MTHQSLPVCADHAAASQTRATRRGAGPEWFYSKCSVRRLAGRPSFPACGDAGRYIWSVCAVAVLVLALGLSTGSVLGQTVERERWRPAIRVDAQRLPELSGLVESRIRPGVFWGHGDSGNPPRLVAFDLHGRIVAEVDVAAVNADWEDVTADESGHLYIGDIGNYRGLFGVRQIYKIVEPDPLNPPAEPIKPIGVYQYRLDDGNRFNAESLFWRDGSLHVISRGGGGAKIYKLAPTANEHELRLVELGALSLWNSTGADCSPDGRRLVICGYHRCLILSLTDEGRVDASVGAESINYPNRGGVEAVTFHKGEVLLGAENGSIYRVPLEAFERRTSFR